MGVDTVAIAEHNLNNFEMVPELLKCCDELFLKHADVLKEYSPIVRHPIKKLLTRNVMPPIDWKWEHPPVGKLLPEIDGPFGFSLSFDGIKLYSIHPSPRWSSFIDEADIQQAVLEIIESIVKALGGKKVIYIPDSAYCPSKAYDEYRDMNTIEDIESYLLTECGKPAKTIKSIRQNFTNDEMYKQYPDWDGSDDARAYEVDGYFVSIVS